MEAVQKLAAAAAKSPDGAGNPSLEEEKKPPPPPKLPAPKREFVVNRLQLLQLKEIDDVRQQWHAKILFEFKLVGGNKDPNLVRKKEGTDEYLDTVPKDTLRPTAYWYLKQFEMANATECEVLDQKIVEAKDDLLLFFRVSGRFLHKIDLRDLPYDCQSLGMTLVVNCATTGVFPVEITTPTPLPSFRITSQAFALGNMWLLDKVLRWEPKVYYHEDGEKAKPFSSLYVHVNVSRKPGFYVTNIALPMLMSAPIAFLTFFVPRSEVASRLSASLTVLLATTAYKYAISQMIPKVAYLTLLDRYVLGVMLFIALVCLDAIDPVRNILGIEEEEGGFDVSVLLIILAWFAFHIYMLFETYIAHARQQSVFEANDDEEKREEEQVAARRSSIAMKRWSASVGALTGRANRAEGGVSASSSSLMV